MEINEGAISPAEALQVAAKLIGGRAELARRLGITRASVCQWDVVPALRVLAVEAETGVRRELLRPDIYPVE